ncbi:hypothetical protein [Burkholderia alba]|uniref:hypothetical protein n=1 Tax=Burkholderia alba TaxID=2683677 RepID=UPI002B05BABF|nr:hypothetical protein [Burkholderia alba]
MKFGIRWAALAATTFTLSAAFAQAPQPAPRSASGAAALQDDTAPARPLKPNPAFARLPRYEGTLGGRPIVVRLGPKQDEPGVHGEYQYRDTGEVILLAGDRDGDTLEVEESNDGTNITGVWMGTFDASGALKADRMNTDESDPQPVVLHPVGASPQAPASPSMPQAPQVRHGAPAAQPVGGVSNLSTTE